MYAIPYLECITDILNAELPSESEVIISRDQLRTLLDSSVRIEELAKSNARLTEELQQYEDAHLRAEGFKKENKRLVRELEEAVNKLQDVRKLAGGRYERSSTLKRTPGPTEPPSSERRMEVDESKPVTKQQYQLLVGKYNTIFENLKDMKATRNQWEQSVREEREKQKKWHKYCQGQDRTIAQKGEKIQRLEEEIDSLKAQLRETDERSGVNPAEHTSPVNGVEKPIDQEVDARTVRDLAKVSNSENFGPFNYGGKVVTRDDIIRILDSSSQNRIDMISRQAELPASSPLLYMRLGHANRQSTSSLLAECSRNIGGTSPAKQFDEEQNTTPETTVLPRLQNRTDTLDATVEDAEFDPIELQHSDTTQGDTDLAPPDKDVHESTAVKTEPLEESPPSPDTPVVISSRSVKKRKGHPNTTEPRHVSKVKVESISSSPIGIAACRNLDESIDLDDIGEKVDTPRKRRRILELSDNAIGSLSYLTNSPRRTASGSQDRSAASNPGRFSLETPRRVGTSRKGSTLRPLSTNKQILPRTSVDKVPRTKRIAGQKAVEALTEDGENTPSSKSIRKKDAPDVSNRLDNLLAKPSPPKLLLSPNGLTFKLQTRPSRLSPISRLAYKLEDHQALSRDAPESLFSKTKRVPEGRQRPSSSKGVYRVSAETPKPPFRGSLRGSMEVSRSSSKGTSRPSSKGSRSSADQTPVDYGDMSRPQPRGSLLLSVEHSRPSSSEGAPSFFADTSRPLSKQSIGGTEPRRGAVVNGRLSHAKQAFKEVFIAGNAPEDEPLRSRPLESLALNDFKVNPNYNQGYNYAFTDAVRNQTDRRCLPGCIKPECCGNKFRALAEIQRNPDQPLTMSQEEEDEVLLEEFLGDNAYKLRNMSKDERQETLIQARTRELSKKHGKHRQAYDRRRSPPGYWRADFPTTQEENQDRVKAKQFERDLVARRYEEAMRPGGAYVFRDE